MGRVFEAIWLSPPSTFPHEILYTMIWIHHDWLWLLFLLKKIYPLTLSSSPLFQLVCNLREVLYNTLPKFMQIYILIKFNVNLWAVIHPSIHLSIHPSFSTWYRIHLFIDPIFRHLFQAKITLIIQTPLLILVIIKINIHKFLLI